MGNTATDMGYWEMVIMVCHQIIIIFQLFILQLVTQPFHMPGITFLGVHPI